jgi:hypothetical protein
LNRGYDLVCGYRENRRAPWLTRRFPSALMNAYVRRQIGMSVRDVGCGMRSFQSWVVRDLAAEGESRRLLTPLFLQRARRVTEVALRPGSGQKSGGHSFLTLLGIAADYYLLTARRPFLLSGLVSAAIVVVGTALMLFGPMSVGLGVTACAFLGGLVSLLGEYCQRLYQLKRKIPFYQLRDLPPEERISEQLPTPRRVAPGR